MMRALIGTALALLLQAAPAFATGSPCNAQIGTISPIAAVAYDPFDGVARSVTFQVQAVNNGPDACMLALAVESQPSGSQRNFKMGAKKLRYVVETPGGGDYDNDIDEPRGAYSLAGGAGKTKTIDVVVKVPAGLIGPAGTYTDTLKFRLYRAGGGALGTDRTANASAVVEERAQVNIAGASGHSHPFGVDRIDFHTLTAGEIKNAIVQVRATSAVAIVVQSQNQGRMKHEVLGGDPGVPYTMRLDGTNVNLAAASDTVLRAPPVSLEGASYPMLLQVGDVAGRPAGEYQDLLTVTVSPQ
jgi:hypothetical protein